MYVLAIHVLNKTVMISVIPFSRHMTFRVIGSACGSHYATGTLEKNFHPFFKVQFRFA